MRTDFRLHKAMKYVSRATNRKERGSIAFELRSYYFKSRLVLWIIYSNFILFISGIARKVHFHLPVELRQNPQKHDSHQTL